MRILQYREFPIYADIASVQRDGLSDLLYSVREVVEYDQITMVNCIFL